MKQREIAKNLLAGKSCNTCCRSTVDCGEKLTDIEKNQTCKSWAHYSETALRRKAAEEKLIAKWSNLPDSDLWMTK